MSEAHFADQSSESEFRQHVIETCRSTNDFLLVSYSRKGSVVVLLLASIHDNTELVSCFARPGVSIYWSIFS